MKLIDLLSVVNENTTVLVHDAFGCYKYDGKDSIPNGLNSREIETITAATSKDKAMIEVFLKVF